MTLGFCLTLLSGSKGEGSAEGEENRRSGGEFQRNGRRLSVRRGQ